MLPTIRRSKNSYSARSARELTMAGISWRLQRERARRFEWTSQLEMVLVAVQYTKISRTTLFNQLADLPAY